MIIGTVANIMVAACSTSGVLVTADPSSWAVDKASCAMDTSKYSLYWSIRRSVRILM